MRKECRCGGVFIAEPNQKNANNGQVVNVRVCSQCGHRHSRTVRRSHLYWKLQPLNVLTNAMMKGKPR